MYFDVYIWCTQPVLWTSHAFTVLNYISSPNDEDTCEPLIKFFSSSWTWIWTCVWRAFLLNFALLYGSTKKVYSTTPPIYFSLFLCSFHPFLLPPSHASIFFHPSSLRFIFLLLTPLFNHPFFFSHTVAYIQYKDILSFLATKRQVPYADSSFKNRP